MLQEYLRGGEQTSGFMYPRFATSIKSSFKEIHLSPADVSDVVLPYLHTLVFLPLI